jgi:hypothetical protein
MVTSCILLFTSAALPCPVLQPPSNGAVTTTNGGLFPSSATYSCADGYALTPASGAKRDCMASGQTVSWSGAPPTCVAVACPAVASPAFGTVSTTNSCFFPSTATYSCSPGYALTASLPTTRTCLAVGTTTSWSDQPPTCVALVCATLTQPSNCQLLITNNGVYPSSATYSCSPGYRLSSTSSARRDCIPVDASVVWSGVEPRCEALPCAAVTAPEHGSVSVTNNGFYPSTATYTCDDGYALNPSDPSLAVTTRTCGAQADGVAWSSAVAPTCTALPCPALVAPANGQVSVTNGGVYPSSAVYTCLSGYGMFGFASQTCVAAGTSVAWNHDQPVCDGEHFVYLMIDPLWNITIVPSLQHLCVPPLPPLLMAQWQSAMVGGTPLPQRSLASQATLLQQKRRVSLPASPRVTRYLYGTVENRHAQVKKSDVTLILHRCLT